MHDSSLFNYIFPFLIYSIFYLYFFFCTKYSKRSCKTNNPRHEPSIIIEKLFTNKIYIINFQRKRRNRRITYIKFLLISWISFLLLFLLFFSFKKHNNFSFSMMLWPRECAVGSRGGSVESEEKILVRYLINSLVNGSLVTYPNFVIEACTFVSHVNSQLATQNYLLTAQTDLIFRVCP